MICVENMILVSLLLHVIPATRGWSAVDANADIDDYDGAEVTVGEQEGESYAEE
jgi:hypothetical protein